MLCVYFLLRNEHREQTILPSRERVNKGTKRMNSLTLLSSLLSYATLQAKPLLTNPPYKSLESKIFDHCFHETEQAQNEVGRFFYNLAELVLEYFCDSGIILATSAKFCLNSLFAT